MSVEDAWHARSQLRLFFKCLLSLRIGRLPKNNTWVHGPNDVKAHLVFFSTFEELKLQATGPMDHATTKLYKQSPTQILYVGPRDLMLGRVPLFPLFLKDDATPTKPRKLRHLKGSAFQLGTAEAATADGSRGSNVYEVNLNQWLWQFGRGRPSIGGLFVSQAGSKTAERRTW